MTSLVSRSSAPWAADQDCWRQKTQARHPEVQHSKEQARTGRFRSPLLLTALPCLPLLLWTASSQPPIPSTSQSVSQYSSPLLGVQSTLTCQRPTFSVRGGSVLPALGQSSRGLISGGRGQCHAVLWGTKERRQGRPSEPACANKKSSLPWRDLNSWSCCSS